jgi:hypothetical protein
LMSNNTFEIRKERFLLVMSDTMTLTTVIH